MSDELKKTIGTELKRIRKEKGLSLSQVHRKTNIPLNTLQAFEDDKLGDINTVYLQGFLKIYCNLLGVDYHQLIKQNKDIVSPNLKSTAEKAPVVNETITTADSLATIDPEKTGTRIKSHGQKIRVVAIIVACLVAGFGLVKLVQKGKEQVVASNFKKVAKKKVSRAKKSARATVKVTIRAKQDCWIRATVDDRIVYQKTLKAGLFVSWKAKNDIKLSLGNAGGIELEINGKLFSPLGRPGQRIKRVLINKDGLKVLK